MGLALVNQYAEDFDVSKYKDEYLVASTKM